MRAVRFELSGKTAFFKKPDVNTYVYFSYSNIHKVALLGILGAIIGLRGYNKEETDLPEFLRELRDLKIGIVPSHGVNDNEAICSKKIQTFNNSVGYASQENGGNLVVKEQWLENPKWTIYLLDDGHSRYNQLREYLVGMKCVYMPYLGKNDHIANICNVEEIELKEGQVEDKIDSLCAKDKLTYIEEKKASIMSTERFRKIYKYEEKLPVTLDSSTYQYILQSFIYTNKKAKVIDGLVFNSNNKNIYFF